MKKQTPTTKTAALAKTKPPAKKTPTPAKKTPRPVFATGVKQEAAALALVPPPTPDRIISGDDIQLGQLGMVALTLTAEQEAVLARPAPAEWLRVKPNGAVYVSHPQLTALMNSAFGRFGWALLPASMPKLSESGNGRKQVTAYYVLHIGGKPVAAAVGEQDYSDKNPEQSYGDAAEGTVASGLRRCLKRIGVFPELWDRDYTRTFLHAHCVQVQVRQKWGNQQTKEQWRLKSSAPFEGELAHRSEQKGDNRYEPGDVAPAGAHASETEPITRQQQARLFTILKSKARTDEELREYLLQKFRLTSTADIQRRDYDTVVRWVEAPKNATKALPAGAQPEPARADDIEWSNFSRIEGREPGSDDGDE